MSDSPKFLIAIATFNELENLPRLVDQLFELLPWANLLIVDDNSPDGTPSWLKTKMEKDVRLNCIIRKDERGLGSASRAALQWAIENQYELVATMDADFSHDPKDLPRMVDKLKAHPDIDVVIGSRYISGGKIIGWSWIRRVSSYLINLHSRIFLGLRTRDNSGAFRIYRSKTIRELGTENIRSNGYVYLQEILFLLKKNGAKFEEVPITFRDRELGQSKINIAEACKAVWKIIALRFSSTAES